MRTLTSGPGLARARWTHPSTGPTGSAEGRGPCSGEQARGPVGWGQSEQRPAPAPEGRGEEVGLQLLWSNGLQARKQLLPLRSLGPGAGLAWAVSPWAPLAPPSSRGGGGCEMRYSRSDHRVPGGLVISQPPCPLNLEPASPKLEAPSAGDSFEAVSQRLLPGCPFLGGGPWRPAVLRGVAGFLCRERSCAGTAGSAPGMPLRGGRRRRDFSWTGAGRLAPWQPPPGAVSGLTSEPVLGRPCGRAAEAPARQPLAGGGALSNNCLKIERAGSSQETSPLSGRRCPRSLSPSSSPRGVLSL